ncbi:hypothetical protein EW026_g4130 [Hermanssonia centrifuga]|uniref:T6SS Phospholipase effector Tle1-like catalytic domain-containing protein n=1 Tax=Hermanssonia centrifuga TaxID=98765 RepID=A0A4S4KJC1_9APHY|nr:hypothetical protein EW026_g4130 [Hermanssonia centrifuga]
MQNYTAGDKICMFGFSRGAYTARALAGMLHKVGLLPSGNFQQIPFAYKMYEGDDMDLIKYYKRANCREVDIDFLGVWDTVASVGLLPQYLPHVHDNDAILQLRHAIALDEHRVKFIPQFCVDPKPENLKEKKAKEETPFKVSDHIAESPQTMFPPVNSPTKESTKREEERRRIREIKEVWFTGVHCDVGGGAVKNKETVKLSGISLRWMIRECFECNTRIVFDAKALRKIGLPVCIPRESPDGKPILEPLYQMSRSDYVAQEITAQEKSVLENFDLHDLPHDYERKRDLHDAMADIHDRLKISPVWYLLEWLPWYVKKEKATVNPALTGWGSYKWTWNRGKGRKIVKREIEEGWLVHRTVLLRLYADENYAPKVRPNITAAKASRKNPTKKTKRLRALTREEWISGNNLYKHKQRAWEWVPSLKAESEKYKE